ncbi:PREDICTED: alkaline phosphatase-like [Priapulus caudatus]|uniref:Alkaline phosphatase n=1 Tax=Priapulus caudatus TaxID=37621 RepID=A0ABM1EHG8_PRICU|nr:PREDICTED: alkaline phosphatase-like [Priapulus caudatus]
MKSTTARTCLRIFIIIQAATFVVPSEDAQFWNEQTQALLNKYLQTDYNCGVAKNAILFIGDGMGLPSQFTGRVLKGQIKGKTGEEEFLEWEKWQHTGLAKTYNTDYQVPDSAATATAFLCGVKAKKGTVGLDDTLIDRGDCPSASKAEVSSIAEWAIAAGKSAGLITSARVTHASPAPLYAHSADRKWESDTAGNSECRDIARQLIEDMPGKQLNVVLGGGRSRFTPTTLADIEYPEKFGRRSDFRNLINEWTEEMTKNELQHAYVWNATQFNSIDPADVDYLLGLFEPDELPTVLNKSPAEAGNPTLAEMLRKAIQILQKNPNGYYLFVESSNIDWAHHDGQAYMATQEVLVLDDAVQVAMDMTNPSDTLLVVTADHSHVMTVAGYPKRGNPMFDNFARNSHHRAGKSFEGATEHESDPKASIRKIAEYLGRELTEDQVDLIAEATSFKKMKTNPKANYDWLPQTMYQKHRKLMRKGV